MGQAAQKEKRKEQRTSVTSTQDENEEEEQNSTRTTDDDEETDQRSTPALDDNEETAQPHTPAEDENEEKEQTSTPIKGPSSDGDLKVSESDFESQYVEMKWKPKTSQKTKSTNKDAEPELQQTETTKNELESKPKSFRAKKVTYKAVQSDPQLSQETKNTNIKEELEPEPNTATKVKIVLKPPDDMQLTPKQEAHLVKCFEELDKDGSGRLDTTETANLLRLFGCNPTDEEVDAIIANYDVDESNSLDYEEYKKLVTQAVQAAIAEMREGFENAFNEFDKDGSGKLDKEELREALKTKGCNKMTDEEVDELFEDIDTDGDGKLDKDELMKRFCEDLEKLNEEDGQENQGQDEES